MGLTWTKDQIPIATLINAGKTDAEVVAQLHCSQQLVNKVRVALKKGDKPPVIPVTPTEPPAVANPLANGSGNKPKGTPLPTAVEAALKRVLAKVVAGKGDKSEGEGKGRTTEEPLEATYLQAIQPTKKFLMSGQILMSFMCAVSRGFEGTLDDWLSLACEDFWMGRNINLYEVVASIKTGGDRDADGQAVAVVGSSTEED